MKQLHGKRALITGAASGIGRAIALALAREGVSVYLLDIDEDGLEMVSHEVRLLGVEGRFARCDLSSPQQVSLCVLKVLNTWGSLDILVNNAGVAYYGPTDQMTAEEWNWLLSINLLAPIQLTRELLPTLLAQPEAHIVNVCSIAGLVAGKRLAGYHASKFALVGLTESLRAEYSHRGLGLTALCPGLVRTRMFESAVVRDRRRPLRWPRWLSTSPELVACRAVRAIRKNQGLVVITLAARLLWYLKRLSPGILDFCNRFRRKRSHHRKSHWPTRNVEHYHMQRPAA